MKKGYKVLGWIVAGASIFFLYQLYRGTVFLYRSEKKIEEKLLLETPVGTSLEEVREYLEVTPFHASACLTFRSDVGSGHRIDSGPRKGEVVGDHSIRVHLGDYQGIPWGVSVVAFWVFENGAVTEILVKKYYEGL